MSDVACYLHLTTSIAFEYPCKQPHLLQAMGLSQYADAFAKVNLSSPTHACQQLKPFINTWKDLHEFDSRSWVHPNESLM